jgi:hypothetical protein
MSTAAGTACSRQSKPDKVLTWDEEPGLQGLVWNLTDPKYFEITSTVFYSPVTPGKKSKTAFMFHHGHSNCICPMEKGDPVIKGAKCRCAPQLSYGGSLRCRP